MVPSKVKRVSYLPALNAVTTPESVCCINIEGSPSEIHQHVLLPAAVPAFKVKVSPERFAVNRERDNINPTLFVEVGSSDPAAAGVAVVMIFR